MAQNLLIKDKCHPLVSGYINVTEVSQTFDKVWSVLRLQHPSAPLFGYVTWFNYKLTTKGGHGLQKCVMTHP